MVNKRILVRVLRDLADMVEGSSEEELHTLLKGGAASLAPKKRRVMASSNGRKTLLENPGIDAAVESLKFVATRESGFEVLERLELTRAELQILARRLDLQVMREDNSHRLMEKIVESSVGARLNSQAIRGS